MNIIGLLFINELRTEMNLLWNLLAFLVLAIAIVVDIILFKSIFRDCLWRKRARLCHKRAKRWWKKDGDTRLTGIDSILEKKWEHLVKHKRSFTFFGTIIGGILIVVFLVLLYFTTPWVEQGLQEPQWTPWGKVVSSIVTPLVAFVITLLGIWRVFRQFQIQVKQVGDQAKNSSKQMAAEQFKNAVDHLGEDKQAVVLGGVHALHNLAVNFRDDYSKQVFEVLCSFLREATADPVYQAKVKAKLKAEEEKQKIDAKSVPSKKTEQPWTLSLIVIQTIVDKLFRDANPEESVYRDRETKQYYQADLTGVFLPKVNLENANLQGALLRDANLQGAKLRGANLQEADLYRANLQGAALWDANLQGANLWKAKLQGAWLRNVKLQRTALFRADFRGVQSQWGYQEPIKEVVKKNDDLTTNLSGIRPYDNKGNKLECNVFVWFREQRANVDNLPAAEVQKLFKDLVQDWE